MSHEVNFLSVYQCPGEPSELFKTIYTHLNMQYFCAWRMIFGETHKDPKLYTNLLFVKLKLQYGVIHH